jgi:site-specific recombinase XerD
MRGVEGMPYGFIQHIENKGYSLETIKSYDKVISQFFAYIQNMYPDNKEPFQISPSDIKNYLEEQQEKEKSISTINKELAIIKTMFHYFWEIDKVPVDPAVKIKRYKVNRNIKIEVTYEQISKILKKTLSNDEYSSLRKAIFLLAAKGLKTADFRFKREDVILKNEDEVTIQLKNRMVTLIGKEARYFREFYDESMTNGSKFVFVTKKHGDEFGGPIQVMSILSHLRAISQDYLPSDSGPLTLLSIRRALAFELYRSKASIQVIARELGIEESSASNFLKNITEGTLAEKAGTVS